MIDDQLLSSYDYTLPPELIAQTPAVPRDNSRLLVVDSSTTHVHSIFRNLPNWLQRSDLLVLNNTRVIPARLYGYKSTGAPVEVLLLEKQQNNCWLALVKPGKRFKLGTEIVFEPPEKVSQGQFLNAKVVARDEETGGRILQFQFSPEQFFEKVLEQFGRIPLPPYVTSTQSSARASSGGCFEQAQSQPYQYQTIYARQLGAVAAPTAGLHFTQELLQKLDSQGIKQAFVTLHVGIGTFRPVEVESITQHTMHQEWLDVPQATVEQIEKTKAAGGRIIAVGTTVVRALEGAAAVAQKQGKPLLPFQGKTDLFIYPGYQWQVVEGLITNFHLPSSSLLMLVSALIGRERLLALYQKAIQERYRFYSFGDAMLILPEAVKQG